MRFITTGAALAAAVLGTAAFAAEIPAAPGDGLYAEFTTPHGAILVALEFQKVPLTVANFVGLTEGSLAPVDGKPYYTGLKWYRVVPGFVLQSGNPKAPAEGDTGLTFPDEFVPGLRNDRAGILSMANAGPDTNSGEFFLTLADCTRLDYLHTVFGRVVRGLEILPQIGQDEPFTIKILRVGAAAQAFKADTATFRDLAAKAKPYRGEAEPGPTAHFDDADHLLPTDPPRARYFNYKLANFERATGVRIVARLYAQSPPAAEDKIPGAYMRALATRFGVDRRGAFAAYFAADDDWRVWIGEESTAAFLGHPPVPGDLVTEGPLHQKKEAFLDATRAAGDAAFAAQQHAAAPGAGPLPAQHLKLLTDAVLDGIIHVLEPKL